MGPAPTWANVPSRTQRTVALAEKRIVGPWVALDRPDISNARAVVPFRTYDGLGLARTKVSRGTSSRTLRVLTTPGTEESIKALLRGAEVERRWIRRSHPTSAVVANGAGEGPLSSQNTIIQRRVIYPSLTSRGTLSLDEAPSSLTGIHSDEARLHVGAPIPTREAVNVIRLGPLLAIVPFNTGCHSCPEAHFVADHTSGANDRLAQAEVWANVAYGTGKARGHAPSGLESARLTQGEVYSISHRNIRPVGRRQVVGGGARTTVVPLLAHLFELVAHPARGVI
mmetsp:Transcript_1118/g.2045  ORF Transcript_1118/g.2045 Transcript_1118/m.2045 type:complete len:283 (+) Transcript_1118:6806-7654(+)